MEKAFKLLPLLAGIVLIIFFKKSRESFKKKITFFGTNQTFRFFIFCGCSILKSEKGYLIMTIEDRLMDIELALTSQQRMLDELNEVLISHSKEISVLKKENAALKAALEREIVKPLDEETPPPHY